MQTLRQDLVYALRSLRRSPTFTAIVIATLAVGIGPLTAIFSVIDAVLIAPLPFSHPERVVQLWSGPGPAPHGPISPANYLDLREMSRSFGAIAAEDFGWFNLTDGAGGEQPERLHGAMVSPSFFDVLGVRPALGRVFTADQEQPGLRLTVLSDGLWRRRFNGDARVIGERVTMNGESWLVVGVMPAGFDFPGALVRMPIDLWVPLAFAPNEIQRGMRRLGMTARLRAGVTLTQAQRDLDAVAARLAEQYPQENSGVGIHLVPVRQELVGERQPVLFILFGAVTLVLLIACANVANLSLARAGAREREMAIRVALGAGRGRIVRQLLTESVLLAAAGAAVGLVGALWLTDLLGDISPSQLQGAATIGVDWRVLLFLLGATVLSGVASGLAPALRLSMRRPSALHASGRRTSASRGQRRFGASLVVLQVAMAAMLLLGAGLLIRSFEQLIGQKPGFDPSHVLTARLALPAQRYGSEEQQRQFARAALAQLAAIPSVTHAAAIDYLPFARSDIRLDITVEGRAPTRARETLAHLRGISGDYFGAMRIPLLRGRTFAAADGAAAPLVGIVNQTMAARYWPNENPVGRRVRIGMQQTTSPWLTVVGIVGDVKHWTLQEAPEPELYVPLAQSPSTLINFVVRSNTSETTLAAAVREAIRNVDRQQPVTLTPLRALVSESVAEPRFRSVLFGGFAMIALTLAVVGLYGLISFGVAQRARELGVRVALGAQRDDIMRLVMREGMLIALLGIALGIAGALTLTRLLEEMLYQVRPTDALTFTAVSLLLVVTAAFANYVPARRAAKADPLAALQSE